MQIVKIIAILVTVNLFDINSNPVDISSQCVFEEKTILSKCYWRGAWSVEELIVRDQKEFEEYGKRIKEVTENCETASLPIIDFTKYDLISKITRGGCCRDKYKRKVMSDPKLKKITYVIDVEYEGKCEMLCGNFNWAKIPKIPEDYSLEFVVIESKN